MTGDIDFTQHVDVWLSQDNISDLGWIMRIVGHESPSQALGSLIANECRALNGRYAEELIERRKMKRRLGRASRRAHPTAPGNAAVTTAAPGNAWR